VNGLKEPTWLLPDLAVAVHQMLLAEHGGAGGLRDKALLESALARPRHQSEYGDSPLVFSLAASYCYGLARNRPFVDGNKRIALTATAVFLEINGYPRILSWECVQGVRAWFEGRNGKNRSHLIGDKTFSV